MSGITTIKRKGFAGGGKDASTKSFDASANPDRKGGPIGREDRQDKVGTVGGPSQFEVDNQGFTPAEVANQNYSSGDVRDAKEAAIIKNFKAKQYPVYLPGGTATSFARNVFGTPFTKGAKKRTANKRMEYINSLDPRSRKAMIDRLGLAMDEDYEEGEVNYGTELYGDPLAMGKNIYGIDSLDIINYDGEYMKKYGPKPFEGTGGNDQTILPYPYNVQQPNQEIEEVVEPYNQFTYRMDDGQDVIFDDYGTAGYRTTRAAEGGIMGTRARKAMGGIMERVDKRQGYFLGKLVKKVGKAAGKVLKSDIGKAAIAGAAFYYGGGGASAFKNKSFMGGLKAMGSNFMSTKNPLLFTNGELSLGKLAGISGVLPFLAGGAKPNETNFSKRGERLIDPLTGEEATPAQMRESIELAKLEAGNDADKLAAIDQKYNNMLNLQYQANLPDATPYRLYGTPGYRTTAATGGRIGRAEGGLLDLGGMEKDYRAEGGFVPIVRVRKKR